MSKPTREGAALFLKFLNTWYYNETLAKAMKWWLEEFDPNMSWEEFRKKYPVGSEGYSYFYIYRHFWEDLGAYVYHGLISVTLVAETLGSAVGWQKLETLFNKRYAETGRPGHAGQNFQWLAMKLREWNQENPPRYKMEE